MRPKRFRECFREKDVMIRASERLCVCSECTQALLDVLIPDEDLRIYAQIEDRIRESEEIRSRQLEEAQSHIKGEIYLR